MMDLSLDDTVTLGVASASRLVSVCTPLSELRLYCAASSCVECEDHPDGALLLVREELVVNHLEISDVVGHYDASLHGASERISIAIGTTGKIGPVLLDGLVRRAASSRSSRAIRGEIISSSS